MADSRSVFLTAEWRHLAMLNFEIDPAAVRALVPAGTELDDWRGRTFVSLVGFMFLNTRVLGVGIHRHGGQGLLRRELPRRADESSHRRDRRGCRRRAPGLLPMAIRGARKRDPRHRARRCE